MKCSYFLHSVLLLVVLGGCCKVDDSPLHLTATDKELLPNQVGDTIKLKDMAIGIVYNYVVDSVGVSLESSFGENLFSVKKSGCASKILEVEVGKMTFKDRNGSYSFARGSGSTFYFTLELTNFPKLDFFILDGFEDQFVRYRSDLVVNQSNFKDVYEIYISSLGPSRYTRILISRTQGLVLVDDRLNDVLLQRT